MAVLGPTEVRRGDRDVDVGTLKQRALLAALALSRGRAVSVDTIIDLIWGDEPPRSVSGTLQAYVAGLRKSLEPGRPARTPASVLTTEGTGYALRLPDEALDVVRFERAVTAVHEAIQPFAALGEHGLLNRPELLTLARRLDDALALWRGAPFGDLGDAPTAWAERARLDELRLMALEDRMIIALALGQHALAAPELEKLTRAHPLRERLWALRAVALARAGRQADALEALRQLRDVLDRELGLEPSAEIRQLQSAVLRQDPVLDWTPPGATSALGTTDTGPAHLSAKPGGGAASADGLRAAPASTRPPWPMVGRQMQLAGLVGLLERAMTGRPQFAAVVGEPGIGKSRLVAELVARAQDEGWTTLTGQCSQDVGAPPLRPWSGVLNGLGRDLPTAGGQEEGAAFRTWEAIVSVVAGAAQAEPVVVVLDDLHWADTSSLRVLRLLAESVHAGRLLVLATWRPHPEPTGSHADVAEALARRHATRLELEGLTAAEAAEVVEQVSHARPSQAQARLLRGRTDGNPFFLVEFARLAVERGDLAELLEAEHPPAAVQDVLLQRLARLDADTLNVLRTAAVIGRGFDLATLARATDHGEDRVLDVLEPAMGAGLVREDGIDQFLFSHALVPDAITSALSASRRARLHARVAQVLTSSTGRETERARHWLAAGPAHAARAWPAAVSAAAATRRLFAYEESRDLLMAALAAMAEDPGATPRDRYDTLMQLVDSFWWLGQWPRLVETVLQAIDVADEMGDVEAATRAAIAPTQGALWQTAPHGQVHASVIEALRRCLSRLPPEDGRLRCRAMLSLANELYYGASFEERRALMDEALGMAGRLGDEPLLLEAHLVAFLALWRHATAPERLDHTTEAIALAEALGNESALVVALTLRAVVESELGRPEEMWESTRRARALAERIRLPYALIVIESLELPWLAMAGRFDDCEQRMERVLALQQQMDIPQGSHAQAGAFISLRLWQGRSEEVGPVLAAVDDGSLPVLSSRVVFACRGGELAAAREMLRDRLIDLSGDDWFSMLNWCCAAEAALWLEDQDLGARAYERLAPFSGRSCSAGSGNAMGPVDSFLAQAAAVVGEKDLAARHADRALELLEQWRLPLASQWLRGQRERFAF